MQNHQPLVSVVIPVYNHADYVAEALHSVLNQTYSNIEMIIIDDGSKDKSCDVIEKTLAAWNQNSNTKRLTTFLRQPNQGAHVTINKGLSLARGDWLTILNSDDVYSLERIDKLVKQSIAAKAQLAFTYVSGIDKKGNRLSINHWWHRWYEGAKHQLFHAPTVGFQLLQDNVAVSTGNLFFTGKLYREVGPFKDLKLAHDLDFILRALVLAEPLIIREELYSYRLHQSNTQFAVGHLMEKERQEIYREYLVRTAHPERIKNPMAPCAWHWPSEFAKWRSLLKMDRGLDSYIFRPEKLSKNVGTTKKKAVENVQKNTNKKICLISHDLSLSGAPKLVADLALCLKNNGYDPNVIAFCDGPMRAVLERYGISVRAPKGGKLKRWLLLPFILGIYTKKVTIANTLISLQALLLLLLLRPFQSIIWYIHDASTPAGILHHKLGRKATLLHPFLNLLRRKKSLTLWFGSKSTQTEWKYSGFQPGKVLYWSGIPIQQNNKDQKTRLTRILAVGTACARKGTFHLVDAFISCLKEKRIPHDATLTIVGFPSPSSPDFMALGDLILKVVDSGYKEQIQMVGSVDPEQLETYYGETDVFIQTSILECMPISILTAMSKGLPIISTDVNGCSEAIQHLDTGYLCLPYNTNSISDALVTVLNNPKSSVEMGKRAQQAFNARFSLEVTQKAILDQLNM